MADTLPREVSLTTEDKQVLRTARVIDEMVATAGWKVLAAILTRKLQEKRNEYESPAEVTVTAAGVVVPLDGISQLLRSESAKGSIMGIRLALELPGSMLADAANLRIQKKLAPEDDL